jgi:hypothetical protein
MIPFWQGFRAGQLVWIVPLVIVGLNIWLRGGDKGDWE